MTDSPRLLTASLLSDLERRWREQDAPVATALRPGLLGGWSWTPLAARVASNHLHQQPTVIDCGVPFTHPVPTRTFIFEEPDWATPGVPSLGELIQLWIRAVDAGAWEYDRAHGWWTRNAERIDPDIRPLNLGWLRSSVPAAPHSPTLDHRLSGFYISSTMTATRRPVQPLKTRPLVDEARDTLLRAIREDRFADGRLPPEAELAEQLGVSRGTLRAALQSLSADGLVSRRRRHGTFVNRHVLRSSMQLNRLIPFARLVEQCGYRASTDRRQHEVEPASETEAAVLEIAEGEEVLKVFRLVRADGKPVISITDVVPLALLTVPLNRLRAAETTFAFLELNAGAAVDYATSEIVPQVATATTPAGLELAAGTPYIQLHEVVYDHNHAKLALSVVCVVDRLVRLSLVRRGH